MGIVCITAVLMAALQIAAPTRHIVYWDREKIPDLGEDGLLVRLEVDDWMDVLCPYVPDYDDMRRHKDADEVYLHIFNVTEAEYRNCDTTHGVRVQACDDPTTEKKLTTKFQERSPSPFGFTFKPGSTYYYVSKARHDRSRGCTRHSLKMAINVEMKGSVFDPDERHSTKTYHKKKEEHATTRHTGLTPKLPKMGTSMKPPKKPSKPNRHHHHNRRPPPNTTTTETYNYTTSSGAQGNAEARASPEQQSGGGNGAQKALPTLFIASTAIVAMISCRLLTDFESIKRALR